MSSFFDFDQPLISNSLTEQTIKTELISQNHDFSGSQFPDSFSPFGFDNGLNNSIPLDLSIDNIPPGLDNEQTPGSANSVSPHSPLLNTSTTASVLSCDTYTVNDDPLSLPLSLAEKRKASVSVTSDDASEKTSKTKKVDPSVPVKKPGKPGRKIDNTEPASKRKAQNRAAQRAFRERKEKHLKDLEDRVAELETESQSKNNENKFLKDQVVRLENELKKYRSLRNSNVSVPSTESPKKFTFEFPFYASKDSKSSEASGSLKLDKSSPLSFNQSPSLISDSSSSQATPDTADTESFCDKLNLACGNTDNPIPVIAPASESASDETLISSQELPLQLPKESKLPPSNDMYSAVDMISPPIFELDFLSEYRDPTFDKEYFNSIDNLTTEVSVFDPLEPANFINSNSKSNSQPSQQVELMKEETMVPAKKENMMTCTAVWDRISAHPKFNNLDIDGLCAELRTKAKCSENGVVISESDLTKTLWSIPT